MRFIIIKGLVLWIVLAVSAASTFTFAGGVSPYLPVKVSPILENEVERLATISGMSGLTKPYSLATIFSHMEKIKQSHPRLYSRLRNSLRPYTRSSSITQLSFSAKASQDHKTVPNQRGTYSNTNLNASFRGQWQVADWFGIYLGADATRYKDDSFANTTDRIINRNFEATEIQATGSLISLGTDWAQVDIGFKDIWLSPFQGSAQLLSTNAQTMPSISVSNNQTIETFGVKWNYNAFLAQTSRQLVQFKPGEFSDQDKPLLAGMNISFQPTDWWSIGATRVFQFAGGDRPVSFGTLARAFFDPRGADNDASVDEESGNQIAALSSKINFDGSVPFSFMLELAGEDTSNNKAYQLGNTSITAGLYFPYLFSEKLSLNYEYSDWQTGWYNNNVYQEGYVNEAFVLGHWAMQPQREMNTTTPGLSHYLKTQWQFGNDHLLSTQLRYSELQSTPTINFSNAWEINLDYTIPWESDIVTLGAYFGEDSFGEKFSQVSLTWEI